MSARTRRPGTVRVIQDLVLFGLGLAIIIHEAWFVPPRDFNPYLAGVAMLLLNVPGARQLWRTGGSPTRPEREEPPRRSRSSSRGAGADR